MRITSAAGTRDVSLDEATDLVDGRVMVPMRAIAEGLGYPVIYEPSGQSIWVNYTEAEKREIENTSRLVKALAAGRVTFSAIMQVFVRSACGQFCDLFTFSDNIEVDPNTGAILVHPDGESTVETPGLSQVQLGAGDVVFVADQDLFIFRASTFVLPENRHCWYPFDGPTGDVVTRVGPAGDSTDVSFRECSRLWMNRRVYTIWYHDRPAVAYGQHVVLFQFDPASGSWKGPESLAAAPVLLNPYQRMKLLLQQALTTAAYRLDGTVVSNVFSLDPAEVERYLRTWDDQDIGTFKVIKDAQGRPAFCISTGQVGGLSPAMVNRLQEALDIANQADPTIVRKLVDSGGVSWFTRTSLKWPAPFDGRKASGTYGQEYFGGTIYLNEPGFARWAEKDPLNTRYDLLCVWLAESFGLADELRSMFVDAPPGKSPPSLGGRSPPRTDTTGGKKLTRSKERVRGPKRTRTHCPNIARGFSV